MKSTNSKHSASFMFHESYHRDMDYQKCQMKKTWLYFIKNGSFSNMQAVKNKNMYIKKESNPDLIRK